MAMELILLGILDGTEPSADPEKRARDGMG